MSTQTPTQSKPSIGAGFIGLLAFAVAILVAGLAVKSVFSGSAEDVLPAEGQTSEATSINGPTSIPNSAPRPLVASRSWTRASDSKTLAAEALHVRAGDVVFADASGNWFAVKVSDLIPGDQEILRAAMIDSPTIPAGFLIGSTRAKAAILLGPPRASYTEFDSWSWPVTDGADFSIKVSGQKITGFMIDLGWKGGLSELLASIGLNHMVVGQRTKNGPIETAPLRGKGLPIVTFRGTVDPAGGWVPVNFDIQ